MASRSGPEDGVRAPSGRCNPHDLGTTRISPAPNPQCRNEPRKCKLRLNFSGLILNVRRMRLEYWVQQVAMGREVQERSRREGCGPEWRLSALRSSAEVDDERRWNQVVRVLGVVCFGEPCWRGPRLEKGSTLHWCAVIYRWLGGYPFLASASASASADIAMNMRQKCVAAEHAGTTESRARE
jgi:hypothetical protein